MKFSACGVEDMANPDIMLELTVDMRFLNLPFANCRTQRKIQYNDDMLTSWDLFLTKGCNVSKSVPVKITYVDDEGDQIVLGSDSELVEALKVAKKCGNKLEVKVEVQCSVHPKHEVTAVMEPKCKSENSTVTTAKRDVEQLECAAKCDKVQDESNVAEDAPPAWFLKYMQNFKKEIVSEIKSELGKKLEHLDLACKDINRASRNDQTMIKTVADELYLETPEMERNQDFMGLACEKSSAVSTNDDRELVTYVGEELSDLDIGSDKSHERGKDVDRMRCSQCATAIFGTYYKCGNCEDYNLCWSCERVGGSPHGHDPEHVFIVVHKSKDTAKGPVPCWESAVKRMEQQVTVLNTEKYKLSTGSCLKDPETGFSWLQSAPMPVRLIMDAEFLFDETVPDGSVFPPGAIFTKRWRVINCGNRPWNKETTLRFLWGSKHFTPSQMEIPVPPLYPGQDGSVEVKCTAPMQPGFYENHWNFVHKNHLFGHRIWCSIAVSKSLPIPGDFITDTESQNLKCDEKLSAEGFVDNINNDVESSPISSTSSSHLKLTLPDQLILNEDMTNSVDKGVNTESDISSIVSASSCDSDQEFVVVPMPPCFIIPGLSGGSCEMERHKQNSTRTSASSSVIFLATPDSEEEAKLTLASNILDCDLGTDRITDEHSYSKTTVLNARGSSEDSGMNESTIVDDDHSDSHTPLLNAMERIDESGITNSTIDENDLSDSRTPLLSVNESIDEESGINPFVINDGNSGINEVVTSQGIPVIPPPENTVEQRSPWSTNDEHVNETVVQILPEGLVSAAAMLFNGARAAISNVTRNSPPREQPSVDVHAAQDSRSSAHLTSALWQMGFYNKKLNEWAIEKHNGDMDKVVEELLRRYENDWHSHRH